MAFGTDFLETGEALGAKLLPKAEDGIQLAGEIVGA
jgi:hypothetical protein